MKPLLILNIAWMRDYRGVKKDQPHGTFGYIRRAVGVPHEIFNFLPSNGKCYGYAAVTDGHVNIGKLGANEDDESVDEVLVVWTATSPAGGKYIVRLV
jgi:hypothetical protein